MGALTEPEIFGCLTENLRMAAEHCETLAKTPRKGPIYQALRSCLKLIEGAAHQAAYWRQDARWLQIEAQMAEVHKRAGLWLRGFRLEHGGRVHLLPGEKFFLFNKLAEVLRKQMAFAETFRTAATGQLGPILPKPGRGPHRDTRPVSVLLPSGMHRTPGGLIIPSGASVQ